MLLYYVVYNGRYRDYSLMTLLWTPKYCTTLSPIRTTCRADPFTLGTSGLHGTANRDLALLRSI